MTEQQTVDFLVECRDRLNRCPWSAKHTAEWQDQRNLIETALYNHPLWRWLDDELGDQPEVEGRGFNEFRCERCGRNPCQAGCDS